MTIFNKRRATKFLRVQLYEEDWNKLHVAAHGDCKALATWVRDKLLDLVKTREDNTDNVDYERG